MKTRHEVYFVDAGKMETLPPASIDLVVTSPPFGVLNPKIGAALKKHDGGTAFEWMHRILDTVWGEVYRVLKPGGIACVNISDATRTIDENFSL